MLPLLVAFGVGVAVVAASPVAQNEMPPPTFADAYFAQGRILLPYAKINEKFSAYYDSDKKMSRIDYGRMKTFQAAEQSVHSAPGGASFKVPWVPNILTHEPERVCYKSNGTKDEPVEIQSVLPDLSDFTYAGEEDCAKGSSSPKDVVLNGTCSKWKDVKVTLNRNSTYSFWAKKQEDGTFLPSRYEMMGYDDLFGSHYDLYEIIYTYYEPGEQEMRDLSVSLVLNGIKCRDYDEGFGLSSNHLFNPMREFVQHDESHLDERFDHFKKQHNKVYEGNDEQHRKNVFRHNQRYVNSMNRNSKSFKLKLNHLADLQHKEMKYLRGTRRRPGPNGGQVFRAHLYGDPPAEIDWRKKGVVTEVKDQAICGSCWAFGITGHLESMYMIKNEKPMNFSEQQLLDCSWDYGNHACDGGEDYFTYRYIMDYGLSSADQYEAYRGTEGKCHDKNSSVSLASLAGYVNVIGIENVKKAISFVGPIPVSIDASHLSFSFYSHGILDEPKCGNTINDLDHSVLAVGYGEDEKGKEYWILKNSWSTYWGDDGYVKMAIKDNMCGVATAATHAILSDGI